METTTSFDLNRAVQRWRESFAQSPAFRRENLDELESHLRDAIATLQTSGLSIEEAFLIGVKRIGRNASLETEFGKLNRKAIWLDRFLWMLIGYQVWGFISGTVGLITQEAVFFGMYRLGYNFHSAGGTNFYPLPVALFGLMQLVGFAGSLALCFWLFCRKGQPLGSWFGKWLHHRWSGAFTCGVLCLLFPIPGLISFGMRYLTITSLGPECLAALSVSQAYSSGFARLVTAAVFVWLTLFLARKRLALTTN
ncbi:MAG: hypothetical protein U1F83_18645 [Verrucomicrobiota bacterium]